MIEWFNVVTLIIAVVAIAIAHMKRPVINPFVDIKDKDELAVILKRVCKAEIADQVNNYLKKVFKEEVYPSGYSRYHIGLPPSIEEKLLDTLCYEYRVNFNEKYSNEELISKLTKEVFKDNRKELHEALIEGLTEEVIDEIVDRIKRKQL